MVQSWLYTWHEIGCMSYIWVHVVNIHHGQRVTYYTIEDDSLTPVIQ